MLYNVYAKNNATEYTIVYVKEKVGTNYKYTWTSIRRLNDKYCTKNYTKVSFNIFEAKQFINEQKASDKYGDIKDIFEYWIEEVKD